MQDGKQEQFAFQAVIVEASATHAAQLRERLHARGDPDKVKNYFPYIGGHHFIPLLKSKVWTTCKIYRLAKLHAQKISSLKPVFVHNLQDLQTPIGPTCTLCQGFYE